MTKNLSLFFSVITLFVSTYYPVRCFGNEIFLTAATEGNLQLIKQMILEEGDLPNQQNKYGNTALIKASVNGHLPVVKFLIENGADVYIKNRYGETAFMMAAEYGHIQILKYLFHHFQFELDEINYEGQSALLLATRGNKYKTARFLIENKADVHLAGKEGIGPLHAAAYLGNTEIAELLIGNGADVDLGTETGATPLQLSAKCGHVNVAKVLLKHNADINRSVDGVGGPILQAIYGGQTQMVRFLRERGAKLKFLEDKDKKTLNKLLIIAARDHHASMVRYLLDLGADPNYVSPEYHHTALKYASLNADSSVIIALLEAKKIPVAICKLFASLEIDQNLQLDLKKAHAFNGEEPQLTVIKMLGCQSKEEIDGCVLNKLYFNNLIKQLKKIIKSHSALSPWIAKIPGLPSDVTENISGLLTGLPCTLDDDFKLNIKNDN